MAEAALVVGIDIAKAECAVAVHPSGAAWTVPHTEEGIRSLTARLRPLPDAATQALGALVTRRRRLVDVLTAERNRLGSAPPVLRRELQAHIAWLERRLARLATDLGAALRASPCWRTQDDLRRSVPGMGPVLAATLLADLPELGALSRTRSRPWSAWRPWPGTAGRPGGAAGSGAAGRRSGRRSPWPPSRPSAATPCPARAPGASPGPGRSRRWRHGVHAEAPHDPERHGEAPGPLGPAPRGRVPFPGGCVFPLDTEHSRSVLSAFYRPPGRAGAPSVGEHDDCSQCVAPPRSHYGLRCGTACSVVAALVARSR
jgi:hypothetical protein